MQAIVTKYLGPTNFRGSRVVAKCQAKRISVSWDDALDVDGNHAAAANQLVSELGWTNYGKLVGGGLPGGEGNCYVFVKDKASQLAQSVMAWASEGRDHGGNPHCYSFVKLATEIAESV